MAKNFFGGASGGGKASMWEAATSNIVNAGSSIAKDALSAASDNRAEIAFNDIYEKLIGTWQGQTDELLIKVFDGSEDSIKTLDSLFSDGKMIDGKPDNPNSAPASNHTDNWLREKSIQRAFYAAAIPAAWTANLPAPVVVDFGPSCEIDARDYFFEHPNIYNSGWRCPDGHSYILAGVRDGPQEVCLPATPGDDGGCFPAHKWTLDILKGIGVIQNDTNVWGGVTVDDLIIG